MVELILVRHAESEWNARGLWQGQADPPLSCRGRAEAARAAAGLSHWTPVALYTSNLRRAAETAAILGEALGLEPRSEPRLREFHVGAWSGLSAAEVQARWPDVLQRFRARDPDVRPPGGETPRELLARVRAALEEIAARHAGQRVALVTHGGVAGSLFPGTRLANLGVLRVRRRDGVWAALPGASPQSR